MSNGESKIAIFKAALCYGFAIALRALFLGILQEAIYPPLQTNTTCVRAQNDNRGARACLPRSPCAPAAAKIHKFLQQNMLESSDNKPKAF